MGIIKERLKECFHKIKIRLSIWKNSLSKSDGNTEKSKKKIIIVVSAILAVVFLFAGSITFAVSHYLGKINYDRGDDQSEYITEEQLNKEIEAEEGNSEPDSPIDEIAEIDKQLAESTIEKLYSKDVFNLLLIGSDTRQKNGRGRSDSMILVSINRKTESIHLTSIMRDIYTSIPEHNNNRINAAYAFGGADLLMKTIEQNFGVKVDKYISVDFYSFVNIIDILGGVDMQVSDDEVSVMNNYIRELNRLNNRPEDTYKLSGGGDLHLNGTQALAYARIRYVGNGDFGRTDRQRKILDKVFEKAKKADIPTLKKLFDSVLPMITTNLDKQEILSLATKIPAELKYDLKSNRVPIDGSYRYMRIRGMSVLGVDFDKNRGYLASTIYQ